MASAALFQDITQHGVLIPYRFGTAYRPYLQGPRCPRRRLVTLGYTVYIEKDVDSDWFSIWCQQRGLMQCEGDGWEKRTVIAQCCCKVKWSGKVKALPSAGR
jgi:hypothetical protein